MSGAQTDYSASNLLKQLTVWEEQSQVMSSVAAQVQGTVYTGDAGFFSGAVTAYNQAAQEIGRWCGEGATQMQAIATALGTAAEKYGATERQVAEASQAALSVPPGH